MIDLCVSMSLKYIEDGFNVLDIMYTGTYMRVSICRKVEKG